MKHFKDCDALAQMFAKAYYSTMVYDMKNLGKFYRDDAVLFRNGKAVRKRTKPMDFVVRMRPGTLCIEQVAASKTGNGCICITVRGSVDERKTEKKLYLSQTFILSETDDKIFIDVDTSYLMGGDHGPEPALYLVPGLASVTKPKNETAEPSQSPKNTAPLTVEMKKKEEPKAEQPAKPERQTKNKFKRKPNPFVYVAGS